MPLGMLLEMLAGKKACANQWVGRGTERLRSGTTGQEIVGEIYMGVVAYARMEQIAALKANVRASGPRDPVTNQPVRGRVNDGAPLAGPMEVDAMIAHGTTAFATERTCAVSDATRQRWCKLCCIEIHGEVCAHCRRPENTRDVIVPASTMTLRSELAANGIMLRCMLRDVGGGSHV